MVKNYDFSWLKEKVILTRCEFIQALERCNEWYMIDTTNFNYPKYEAWIKTRNQLENEYRQAYETYIYWFNLFNATKKAIRRGRLYE